MKIHWKHDRLNLRETEVSFSNYYLFFLSSIWPTKSALKNDKSETGVAKNSERNILSPHAYWSANQLKEPSDIQMEISNSEGV